MRKTLALLLFGICVAFAQEIKSPQAAVEAYYKAMNSADISALQAAMAPASFDMTIEVWALSEALKNKAFANVLKQYKTDEKSKKAVHAVVRKKLLRSRPKRVSHFEVTPLGKSRSMVRYKENGKPKQLFTSLLNRQWRVDYRAGRKVD